MRGLVLTLAAMAFAWVAQGFLERRSYVIEGAIALLVCGFVFARAARGTLAPETNLPFVGLPALRASGRLHPAIYPLALAVLMNLVGLILFAVKLQANAAWMLWSASLPLALMGAYELDNRPSLRNVLRAHRAEALAALGLVLFALAVRLAWLDTVPFGLWSDEAANGNEVLRVMRDMAYRPIVGTGWAQGLPALNWYLLVPSFMLLGANELGLRVPTAIGGALGIGTVYLLGRALFGRWVGLAAGAILATMGWHLTFSRISFHSVHTVALDAAAVASLVFALRTGRRSLFALAGFFLGVNQHMYYTSRLALGVVGVFLLHQFVRERLPWLRRHFVGLCLFALLFVLGAGPIYLYAVQNPREFNERAQTVSVFKEIDQQRSFAPLFENIRRHLIMFNVQGDPNGRHNIPGAPMLDRWTAALAVLGFVLAWTRIRRPEYSVLIAWWFFMLLGGILSLAFEAPQGLRTIDEVTAAALLAALPIASLSQRLVGLLGAAPIRVGGLRAPLGGVAAAVVLFLFGATIAYANLDRYFVRQHRNAAVWASHATAESTIGREIAAGRTVGSVYIDQIYMEQPSIKFLAPGYQHTQYISATVLPIRDPAGATIFLQPEETAAVQTIMRMYPGAIVRQHQTPEAGRVALHQVTIPPEVADSVRGSELKLWSGTQATGQPQQQRRAERIELLPEQMPTAPFVAEWRGVLVAPTFGRYAFRLEGPPEATLKVDETELTTGTSEVGARLARGNHTIEVRAPVTTHAPVRLLWRTPQDGAWVPVPNTVLFTAPVTNNGLLGSYHNGLGWQGEPALQQIDPTLTIRIHILPIPRPYSVEWRGKVYAPTDGVYRFKTDSRDESWLWVDERQLVDNSRGSGSSSEATAQLTAGFHDIRVRFVDRTGHTYINVLWTRPGGQTEPIPSALLFPPQGAYPDRVVPPPPAQPLVPAQAAAPIKPGAAPAKPSAAPAKGGPNVPPAPTLPARAVDTIGSPGNGAGQFNQPRGIAFDKAGNMFVADTNNHRIQKLSPNGKALATFGTQAELTEPLAIVVESTGNVVVLDSEQGWLRRYSGDGQTMERFAGPDARLYHPRALAIDAADNLYVADTGGGRVVKFNPAGQQLQIYGSPGTGPGQMREPSGVAVDAAGAIWVPDIANGKLVRFSATGTAELEVPIARGGSFNSPKIALTQDGQAIVTDFESGRLFLYGPDGTVRGAAQVDGLRRPLGIAIGPDGRAHVSDVELHQIVVVEGLGG